MLFTEPSLLTARQNPVHATTLFIIHINLWKRQRPGSFYNFVWHKSFTRFLLPFFLSLKFWPCHEMKFQDLGDAGEAEALGSQWRVVSGAALLCLKQNKS